MSLTCRFIALPLALLAGAGAIPGGLARDRPPVRWEAPPGLLNLRLPPETHALPRALPVPRTYAEAVPPILFPRPDFSRAPWGGKLDFGPGVNLAPPAGGRTVTVTPPASQFAGPNCGPKCAEKRARGAARTERRLW